MNAVIQSSAHPLVVLEQDRLITHTLLDRMATYARSIFLVTNLHRCAVALGAQRPTSVLVLAGKPPKSRWTNWSAQVKSVTHACDPVMTVNVTHNASASAVLNANVMEEWWTSMIPQWTSFIALTKAHPKVTGRWRAFISAEHLSQEYSASAAGG